jgi:hypothetical protein
MVWSLGIRQRVLGEEEPFFPLRAREIIMELVDGIPFTAGLKGRCHPDSPGGGVLLRSIVGAPKRGAREAFPT